MPDTYGHKPSNDELLHDLARIVDASGGMLIVDPAAPSGPVERVRDAVDEYMQSPDWDASQPLTPDYPEHVMNVEHGMWGQVCELLRARGIEINDDDALARTIEMWGETLVELRCNQPSEQRRTIMQERRALYNAIQESGDDEV